MDNCLQQTAGIVSQLQELLGLVQETTKQATDLAAEWAAHSLFELKEGQARLSFGSGVSSSNTQISGCCWSGMSRISICYNVDAPLEVKMGALCIAGVYI